ncbi:MAG: nucleotide exchange factor GrpE, partial [Burkholderiaceae bacterium]|nr:nucleotide exchange factor GrpE [Burkholderiaceae bacterium]
MTTAQTPNPDSSSDQPEVAAAVNAEPTVEAKLAEVEARLSEMSDAYLRAKAEVENIRRRS